MRKLWLGLLLTMVAAIAYAQSPPRMNTPTVGPPAPAVSAPPTATTPTPRTPGPTVGTTTPQTSAPTVNARVDCGNGYFCPTGNACLEEGLCAPRLRFSDMPGAVKTSTGDYCFPGEHENRFKPGTCLSNERRECSANAACPAEATCGPDDTCLNVKAGAGPTCGNGRCAAGSTCSSRGTCLPPGFKECASGKVCNKLAACGLSACSLVDATRTRQIPLASVSAPQISPQTPSTGAGPSR